MNEREIFIAALEKEAPAERQAYLDQVCQQDAALRRRVEDLLDVHDRAGSYLDKPVVAPLLTGEYSSEGGGAQAGESPAENREPRGESSELAGKVIGPYKLVQEIGEGGMGSVWMAQQTEPVKRLVALKLIKPGMDSRQVIARFEAERQALALMDHPNIARVLDAGTTATGRPYFVMELVKGVPITRYCDEHRLTPKERLELFVPVCQAVQHAHQKGIIHRDIKPSNVLVASYDGKPVPRVIDFGIAKATGQQLTEKTLITGFGNIVGTLEYMSPEQAELNALDIDTRSDVYSLGVLLYELLTGSTPLEKKRLKEAAMLEVLRLIREEEPPKPSTRLSTTEELPSVAANRGLEPKKLSGLVRGELDWIVMKALEKDRNRRYETANGLSFDLLRFLNDEPVLACPPSLPYRFRKFARRNKAVLTTAALVLGALVLGMAVSLWQAVRATKAAADLKREQGYTQEALTAEAKRRQQARTALDAMSSQIIEEWLARQPKLLPQHKAYLKKALGYYEEFAADTQQDEESRAGVAEAHYRVGRIQELLNQHKEAEAAYRRSRDVYADLAANFPTVPNYRQYLGATYTDLGLFFKRLGRLQEAETAFRQAVAISKQLAADFPTVPLYRQGLAAAHGNLVRLLQLGGRVLEAEADYRQIVSIFQQLANDFPGVPGYWQGLATSHWALGQLLQNTGRAAEAEAAYRQDLAIRKKLANKFPTVPEHRVDLAGSQGNLADLLAGAGRVAESESAFRESLAIRKQLADDFPTVPDYKASLANTLNGLASLLLATGRLAEAEAALRQALAIRKQLAADSPTVLGYQKGLANTLNDLGNVLRGTGRLAEAEAALRQALAIFKQLAHDLPQSPDYQNVLAGALVNLADLLRARREFSAARRLLDEALPHHQAALKANPGHPIYRTWLRNNRALLALLLVALKEHAAAAETAEQLLQSAVDPAADAYNAACFLALCAGLAEHDKDLNEAERKQRGQAYGGRALVSLRQAVRNGYRDLEHLKKDPDLNALRARNDFQKLLQDLEKAKPANKRSPNREQPR